MGQFIRFGFLWHICNIRIYHKCEVWIEKSILRIAFWHQKGCRVMTNGDPEERIFLSVPHTNNGLFLAHLSHWLMVSYCDCWMSLVRRAACVVRHQQLLQTTSPPKLLAVFWPNLVGMILIWPSLSIVQMVSVHCISRSYRLKIDFQGENFKKIFSETTRPRALIFGL